MGFHRLENHQSSEKGRRVGRWTRHERDDIKLQIPRKPMHADSPGLLGRHGPVSSELPGPSGG
jgi:hypothetical protein